MAWEPTIYAVAASGGEPRVVVREDLPKGIENLVEFRPLVAGKSILATRWSFVGQKTKVNTEAIDLASGKKTLVLSDAGSAQYVPDREGGLSSRDKDHPEQPDRSALRPGHAAHPW